MNCYPDREPNQAAARNILRRVEISRLTSNLKSRLALANFKTQRGLENLRLESIEKRELSQGFSSELEGFNDEEIQNHQTVNGRKRARTLDNKFAAGRHSRQPSTGMPAPKSIPNSQSVPHISQNANYLQQPPILLSTSPDSSLPLVEPQTPPTRRQVQQNGGAQGTPTRNDQDGANLLLYLATSPGRGAMSPRTPGSKDINFHEYLHLFTPSPQVSRQQHLANIDSARQRLTFE